MEEIIIKDNEEEQSHEREVSRKSNDKLVAEEMRKKAMERYLETQKRKVMVVRDQEKRQSKEIT